MSEICPCQRSVHPLVIDNPPGLASIAYRVGDFLSFRDALLKNRPQERQLAGWRPTAEGDLALQLLEWWAYLADILSFYNERIANEAYLGTSSLPGGVASLTRVLGYRPRPGIGATGVLAAVVSAAKPILVPTGFAVQSKPAPGKQPEIFEVDQSVAACLPSALGGVVAVDVIASTPIDQATSLLLKGAVSSVKVGERLLVAAKSKPSESNSRLVTVSAVAEEKDPRGNPLTRVTFTSTITGLSGAVTSYQLLRSTQSTPLFPFPGFPSVNGKNVHLASIVRGIVPGDIVVVDFRASVAPTFALASRAEASLGFSTKVGSTKASPSRTQRVSSVRETTAAPRPLAVSDYEEAIWFANAPKKSDPESAPDPSTKIPPIAIPHSVLTLESAPQATAARVSFAHHLVGELVDEPVTAVASGSLSLHPRGAVPASASTGTSVLIEDSAGGGTPAKLSQPPTAAHLRLTQSPVVSLHPPLRVFTNLLSVSRGKTVSTETLGSGDATLAGQEFVLQKSPLTYFAGSDPTFPSSTLHVWVDGIEWQEVPSFYGQSHDARIFVTREDVDQKTHVLFGDGLYGARLSTGIGNVVASYRYGSGKGGPEAGALTSIVKPLPGLQSVRNPVAVGGGDDPAPPALIRSHAPRSVLTFGRAVSASDYEAIALQAPAVTRARAYQSWSATRQQATTKVYVGDDEAARISAQKAVNAAADPNRPVEVILGEPIPLELSVGLAVDPRYRPSDVIFAATLALADATTGFFSPSRLRIGDPVYQSQIEATCLAVPGAVAVHQLTLISKGVTLAGPRYVAGEGGFFQLDAAKLTITPEVAAHV